MVIAAHIFALLLGMYIMYLTFVMRESTEGKWVNRIEALWVRIDDQSKVQGGRSKRLFNSIAAKVLERLDRIVGPKILSPRLVGISGALSLTSLCFSCAVFFEWIAYLVERHFDEIRKHVSDPAALQHSVPIVIFAGYVLFFLAMTFSAFAILPILFRSAFLDWLSCLPTALVVWLLIRLLYFHALNSKNGSMFVAVALSLLSDVVLLVLTRQSLKWMLNRIEVPRMVLTIAVQLLILGTVFALPALAFFAVGRLDSSSPMAMGDLMLAIFNLPTALASASFLILLSVVLVHRATWPLLSDWTYVLTRPEVLRNL